jgi:hypothetical protein
MKYVLFFGKRNENHEFGTGVLVHKIIMSADKRAEFVNNKMSYIIIPDRISLF